MKCDRAKRHLRRQFQIYDVKVNIYLDQGSNNYQKIGVLSKEVYLVDIISKAICLQVKQKQNICYDLILNAKLHG